MDMELIMASTFFMIALLLVYLFKKSDCKSFFKHHPKCTEITGFTIKTSFSSNKNKYYIERFRD